MLSEKDFLLRAYREAQASPDPSTQNGALLICRDGAAVYGHNAPTFGFRMEDWHSADKYALVEHAERNAIYKAASWGYSTERATLVAAWAACADCARAIVQSGIVRLVRHYRPVDERWADSIYLGDSILEAGGVEVVTITGGIHGAPAVRFAGGTWNPENMLWTTRGEG